MSFSLMMPQKYCGFSTKLDKPESSSEEGGLVPKFMKRRDTARSSSVPRTDDPNETGGKDADDKQHLISPQLLVIIVAINGSNSEPIFYPFRGKATLSAANFAAHFAGAMVTSSNNRHHQRPRSNQE